MAKRVHRFLLRARFGPAHVLRALQAVCAHAPHKAGRARFEFDWLARRVALSADDPQILESCHAAFLERTRREGADADSLLAGPRTQGDDGRWVQPYGAAVHEPAVFGELIGNTLLEMGLRGVQIVDAEDGCLINLPQSGMARTIDYATFVREFPLPGYLSVHDLGLEDETK